MGISRHYLKENNFLLSRLCGEINDLNLSEHVLAFNRETKEISDLRELVDCRDIENLENLTVNGATSDAKLAEKHSDYMTAILVNNATLLYGMARAFQMFLDDRRKEVKIFKDFDEALSWLANNDKEINVLKKFIESV